MVPCPIVKQIERRLIRGYIIDFLAFFDSSRRNVLPAACSDVKLSLREKHAEERKSYFKLLAKAHVRNPLVRSFPSVGSAWHSPIQLERSGE